MQAGTLALQSFALQSFIEFLCEANEIQITSKKIKL
jgi:hypothetical protein